MRPGDVITCKDCGATATATWSSLEHPWTEGGPLMFSWTNGPYPRHVVETRPPERCCWCHDRALAYPRVMSRPMPGETWIVRGPQETYEIPVLEGERRPQPSTKFSLRDCAASQVESKRSAGRGPCAEGVQVADSGATRPDTTLGFKAPAEHFDEIATEYRRETGLEPPIQGADAQAWQRWTAWLRRRRQAQARPPSLPEPPPKGQLSLL